MAGAGKPTTPTSVAAGDDEFMMDHMYRLDALKMLAQNGISKPSEQDVKAIAIKLRQKDEQTKQQERDAQLAQAAAAQQAPPQPNLVAAPPPAAAMAGAPGGGAPSAGGPNLGAIMAMLAANGGPPQ